MKITEYKIEGFISQAELDLFKGGEVHSVTIFRESYGEETQTRAKLVIPEGHDPVVPLSLSDLRRYISETGWTESSQRFTFEDLSKRIFKL